MPIVLVVDDEPENLRSLKRFLEDHDPSLEVVTAKDETEARVSLNSSSPDVIITDLVMTTDQGGMEVLAQAKLRDPLTMVILITAFEKKLDRYRAFDLGAFDCVQKNVPGVIAAEEILVKTRAALRFRDLARQQIDNERKVAFLKRYFDPRVFSMIQDNPEFLNVSNRLLTICFWDIRGFSLLCEILKAYPTLISGFLKEYSKVAAEVIFENNGVLDKYIGDGVMAVFYKGECQEKHFSHDRKWRRFPGLPAPVRFARRSAVVRTSPLRLSAWLSVMRRRQSICETKQAFRLSGGNHGSI